METLDSVRWLKETGILRQSETIAPIVKKVFTPCLGIKDERLLIVGDFGQGENTIAPILSGAYFLAAQQLNLDAKLIMQDPKSRGEEAESQVIQSLSSLPEHNVIILNMSDKLGSIKDLGKSFRKWVKKRNHRFVSAMGLGDLSTGQLQQVIDAIDINYKPFQAKHTELKAIFDHGKELHITTKSGTDLHIDISGIESIKADGDYTRPGSGGNLPAGEVYLPPNGRNVQGKVVIDGSSRIKDGTLIIKDPITLIIEDGDIIDIQGKEEARKLKATLDWAAGQAKNPGSVRRICEFGVGLNPKAKIIGATIVDEKTLGSAHIGIGSNYWFGGGIYAIIHLDQVFKDPIIKCDGKLIELH